jgi:hypothetical protein
MTIEAARVAREESMRLRVATSELRSAVRANSRVARTGRERAAATAARSQARSALPALSPWSKLEWQRDDAELGRALVPVD